MCSVVVIVIQQLYNNGQEAILASIRTGGTRTSKSGDTRVSETRGNQPQNEGTWSLRIKGF